MANSFHRSRYGRYTGGPDPLAAPVDLREAVEEIGRDVMEGTSPQHALAEYLRRGPRAGRGLDELARLAARRRQELLQRANLDGTFGQVRELLDRALAAERDQLDRESRSAADPARRDDAAFDRLRLDQLPDSTAAAVRELADYPWHSSDAREDYEQIMDLLGREVLEQRFAGMKQALENADDADRERVRQMLSDLNDLLAAHARGEDTTAQFEQFMRDHGELFPEQPSNVEELIDALAARAAAAQRMRNSMTPEQRAELDALAQQAFGSPTLMEQLAQLDANLQQLRPGAGWGEASQVSGSEPMGWGEATGALADIAELEQLGQQLSQQYAGASLDDIDLDALVRQLGEQAGVDARTLAELERALSRQGYLRRGADGALRLSPKAIRQLARTQLRAVAERLSGRLGSRELRHAGSAGELTGSSRPWAFGDSEPWDVTRTVSNAVLRSAADGPRESPAVRLHMDDIEVAETETRTRAAVALLVDVSFSMVMEGRWLPMKQTALALSHLIETRFRGDELQIISFGLLAQTISTAELTGLSATYEQGTNLHHGLLLANRFFRRHPTAQPVAMIVTDGEPTAHLERDGEPRFSYPPEPYTLAQTIKELDTTTRLGTQLTFYRLGDDPGLARFVAAMAARAQGTVVAPDLDDLGAAVVSDYLTSR